MCGETSVGDQMMLLMRMLLGAAFSALVSAKAQCTGEPAPPPAVAIAIAIPCAVLTI